MDGLISPFARDCKLKGDHASKDSSRVFVVDTGLKHRGLSEVIARP